MRYLGPEAEILHERYAEAIFGAAKDASKTEEVYKDLRYMTRLTEANESFGKILKNPEIEKKNKKSLIEKLSVKCGFSDEFRNFLLMLNQNGRLNLIHGTFLKFEDLYNAEKKKVEAVVTVPRDMNKSQEKRLKEVLAEKLKKHVTVKTRVVPSVLGGIDIRVGNSVYKFSVSERMRMMLGKIASS